MKSSNEVLNNDRKMTSVFERFLSLWVILCIIAGILLGKIAPGVAQYLDSLAIYVKGAPVVSIPIAVCLFFMMYPVITSYSIHYTKLYEMPTETQSAARHPARKERGSSTPPGPAALAK